VKLVISWCQKSAYQIQCSVFRSVFQTLFCSIVVRSSGKCGEIVCGLIDRSSVVPHRLLSYLLEYCVHLIVLYLTLSLPDLLDQSYRMLVTYVTI